MSARCFVICPNPSVDILAHVHTLEAGMTNRISNEERYPGGKGIHVAMALAELKVPVTLLGIWGSENGSLIKRACRQRYPEMEIIGPIVDGYNRSCFTFVSDSSWNETELLGAGPSCTDEAFTELVQVIESRHKEIACLTVCGSWPSGAKETYNYQLNLLAKSLNIPIFLDCTSAQLENALNSNPYCVHLNYHEVTTLYEKEFLEAIIELSKSCALAAVTNGAKGLYYIRNNTLLHGNVSLDHVLTTVGSGDCLLAGIIAGHYFDSDDSEITKLAVACGAANCISPELGILRQKDVFRLKEEVVLTVKKLHHSRL